MKRATLIVAAAGGLFLVWLVLAGPVPLHHQAEAQSKRQGPQWEYAMVAYVSGKGVTWETPDGVVFGKSFAELNRKMGLKADATQSALFSHFGKDGWELVTHAMRTTGGASPGIHGVWTFKRSVK